MVGELIAGRYELEELVGSGGMSSVYRARDILLERSVALKILHEHYNRDDDYVERFRREARAAAQLTHPNIVTVIDRGEQDGRQFIVFEYVDGENLKELVEREGRLSVREVIDLGVQIARGLSFAHGEGLVHRDVKPQNVLLDGDGRAKVTDFGIARSLDVGGMTVTGTIMGTSNYIAPEQARGQPVDDQTDVYSLGCVLFELLAGEPPYAGDNFVSVAMRHVNDPVPSVGEYRSDVPLRLDWALQRAMAKNRGERFGSMAAFAAELEAARAEVDGTEGATVVVPPTLASAPGPAPAAQRSGSTRRFIWPAVLLGVGLAALAGALVGLVVYGGGSHGSSAAPPRPAGPVKFTTATAFDPLGDRTEHDSEAPNAVDGNRATYWTTETYSSFDKAGVGIVVHARSPVSPRTLTVDTDTNGFAAVIKTGDSPTGPFRRVSSSRIVTGETAFTLDGGGQYFLVWITDLGGNSHVHVNEVTAK